MESEFDREIDALLRQAARGESVSENRKSKIENSESFHLDADEITLFAENALTEKTKTLYTEHFADCQRCRKILSNVISLNSETVKETVHAPETAKISSVVPWYRRLFAAPNLAPALGALVLVFAGLIAFSFLRNSNNSENAEIAQVESTEKMSGPNAGGDAQIIESNSAAMSNGGSVSSNSASSNSVTSGAASSMSNSSALASPPAVSPNTGAMSNSASVSNSAAASKKQSDKEIETAKTAETESLMSSADLARRTKPEANQEKMRAAEDSDAVKSAAPAPKPPPPSATRSAPAELRLDGRTANDLNSARAKKTESDAPETGQTGGKTFKRENGVWYDASYNGQATTNVSRGSEDFKKLDAGLRSIAGNLSGAIVIIWKGKAYRIQ